MSEGKKRRHSAGGQTEDSVKKRKHKGGPTRGEEGLSPDEHVQTMVKDNPVHSPMKRAKVKLVCHLLPKFMENIQLGVLIKLNSLLLKYHKGLGGIPLAYRHIRVMPPVVKIHHDNPLLHLVIHTEFLLFVPRPGTSLTGVINRMTSDHIGLLAYGFINVSIPKTRLDGRYAWNGTSQSWEPSAKKKHLGLVPLALDSPLTFQIAEFTAAQGVLTLIGTLS